MNNTDRVPPYYVPSDVPFGYDWVMSTKNPAKRRSRMILMNIFGWILIIIGLCTIIAFIALFVTPFWPISLAILLLSFIGFCTYTLFP